MCIILNLKKVCNFYCKKGIYVWEILWGIFAQQKQAAQFSVALWLVRYELAVGSKHFGIFYHKITFERFKFDVYVSFKFFNTIL